MSQEITQDILTQAVEEVIEECGRPNLAALERKLPLTREQLKRLKKNNFVLKPNGNLGKHKDKTKLSGFEENINSFLLKGVTNSQVIFDSIVKQGYKGGLTTVKNYIGSHQDLVPAPRILAVATPNRGRRYETEPGELFQMDWGFVEVENASGSTYKVACFAMICHCCGQRYIEFFPNAKQENLFIGMIHAFLYMGIPEHVLTDNMKSVVIRRDEQGHPIWQKDYELFMGNLGFETKLCKPRHPFTKGSVERLVRFVKDNFLPGRVFSEITDLNYEAIRWCNTQNSIYHRAVDCIPNDKHTMFCMKNASVLEESIELSYYLCPERKISFDGFVHYEGRRFGVPYWYTEKTCRVKRDGYILYIYDSKMTKVLTSHDVTWSRRDSFCKEQYVTEQPEERPTAPVKVQIQQLNPPPYDSGFSKFNFEEG